MGINDLVKVSRNMFDLKSEVIKAKNRIAPYIRQTPLDYSYGLSKLTGSNVHLKYENFQHSNSFKVRGAYNKLLTLTENERRHGVVTGSSGNHGISVAHGMNALGIPGKIFVTKSASVAKVDYIRHLKAPVVFSGDDCVLAELDAIAYARENNMTYISPYNDYDVIAGQGTIGFELAEQLQQIDAIFAVVGGGGLISGIAGYIKSISPKTQIIGCLPENSPVMYESIKAGRIIEMDVKHTLSDATAGGIEPDAVTFPLCQKYVDDYVLVTEEEISNSIVTLIKEQRQLHEGASAVPLAALIKSADKYKGKNVVVVLSGANISFDTLRKVILT